MLLAVSREHQRANEIAMRWPREEHAEELEALLREVAQGYQVFLTTYPETTWTYEVQYHLGTVLHRLGREEEALSLLLEVRDSSFSDARFADAAAGVVNCADALARAAAARGDFSVPASPPAPGGEPPRVTALPLPPPVALQLEARDVYLDRVAGAPDSDEDDAHTHYAWVNGRQAYLYGHWDRARRDLEVYYRHECTTPGRGAELVEVWTALRSIAVVSGDTDALARLDVDRAERRCRFPVGPPVYPDTSYHSEGDGYHPWRLGPGERALPTSTEAVRCDEEGGSWGDDFGASIAATARDGRVRVVLENLSYNCGHDPVIAARLHPDGGVELDFDGPGSDAVWARCTCAFDLVVTVRDVPPGEHEVVIGALRAQVSVPAR